jgi:hypothetical protein
VFVLLVISQGKEVYRKLFHRRRDALSWYEWRVRVMQNGTQKTPADTVLLTTMAGTVIERCAGDNKDVRAS